MMKKRIGIGTVPALLLLLAASAVAQIRTTTVPYAPPKDGTTGGTASTTKKTQKSTPGSTKTRAHTTRTRTTTPRTTGTATTSNASPTTKPATGPGKSIQADGKVRACDPHDPSPEGTVIDGFKKVMVPSPLIPHACQWRAVE